MDVIQGFKTHTNNDFQFSDFQDNACIAIKENKHVLVTAHTGSGKTLPALFAIYYWVHVMGKKVIYTSPIKALSNQKYKEMKEQLELMTYEKLIETDKNIVDNTNTIQKQVPLGIFVG